MLPSGLSSFDSSRPGAAGNLLIIQSIIVSHLFLQNVIPEVVFKEPIRRKKGTQTTDMTMAKSLKFCLLGIFVIPKTEVTNVKGRKKIDT